MSSSDVLAGSRRWAVAGGLGGCGGLLIGYAVTVGAYAPLGFLVAAVVGAILAARESRLLYVAVVTSFLWPQAMHMLTLSASFGYVPDILLWLFIGRSLVWAMMRRHLRIGGGTALWLSALAALCVASLGAGMIAVQSLAAYAVFPLFFVAVASSRLSEMQERRGLLVVGFMMAVQVPLSIVQKLSFYLQPESYDRVGGTLGRAGTSTMSIVMAFAWCGILVLVLTTRKTRYMVLLPFTLVPLVLGAANAGFVLACVGSAAVFLASMRLSGMPGMRLLVAIGSLTPVFAAYCVYAFAPWLISSSVGVSDYGLAFFRAPVQRLTSYLMGYQSDGKPNLFEQLRFALDRATDLATLVMGHGLGVLSSSVALGKSQYDPSWSSLGSASSAAKYLVETGIAGVAIFVAFVASLWPSGLSVHANAGNQYARFLFLCIAGALPVFLLAGLYTGAWQNPAVAIPFYLVAALSARSVMRWPSQQSQ